MPATPLSAIDLRDPFQGFDITVKVTDSSTNTPSEAVLQGAFTGFMCRITNHTEAYLPLGQRTPRMLDGEIVVVWSLEQAMVNDKVISHTYGPAMAAAYAKGRTQAPVPRQHRFNLEMNTSTAPITALGEGDFRSDLSVGQLQSLVLDIWYARVDTGSFGVMAGKRMASSSWQGTAEFLTVAHAP